MITALIILLLISGGGDPIDFNDPAVIAQLQQNVNTVITDPNRAQTVFNATQEIGMSSQAVARQTHADLQIARSLAIEYNTTPEQFAQALDKVDENSIQGRRALIAAREKIRLNTTKKEWKGLLKSLSKKKKR